MRIVSARLRFGVDAPAGAVFTCASTLPFGAAIPSFSRTYSTSIPVAAASHAAQSGGAALVSISGGPFRLGVGRTCRRRMGIGRRSCCGLHAVVGELLPEPFGVGRRDALEQPVPGHDVVDAEKCLDDVRVGGCVAALADVLGGVLVAACPPVCAGYPLVGGVVARSGRGDRQVGLEQAESLQVDADAVCVDRGQVEHAPAQADGVTHFGAGVLDVLDDVGLAG